jgi:TonB family protein
MNRLSLKQRLARWAAMAACACAGSGATAYAASALAHVVVLGGALMLSPWGNSGVGFSVAQGNGGTGEHASPLGSAGGSEATDVIRFELLKPRPVASGQLAVEGTPAESKPAIVEDSRPVASEAEPALAASVFPLKVAPDVGVMARYERPNVEEETTRIPAATHKKMQRREATEEKIPDEAELVPAKIARRELVDAPVRGEVPVEVPEMTEVSGRGISGGGTGAGIGEGNGGGRGLAGGQVDSQPRSGPLNLAPPYPEAARLAGAQGDVVVRILISSEGTVSSATLVKSSGWKILDDISLVTIRRWRFDPARRRGVPVESEMEQRFDFYFTRT